MKIHILVSTILMGCIDWCELVRDIIEIMIMEIIVFYIVYVEWNCEILWTMVHLWDRVNPC